jgi:hypothetical protein
MMMNKRWSELAAKCWDNRKDGMHLDQEMFAELIVRECITCVGSQGDKAYLKKHFGLDVESNIVYPATEQSWSVETQYKRKYNLAPDPDMGGI